MEKSEKEKGIGAEFFYASTTPSHPGVVPMPPFCGLSSLSLSVCLVHRPGMKKTSPMGGGGTPFPQC